MTFPYFRARIGDRVVAERSCCNYCSAESNEAHDRRCPTVHPENLIELWKMGDGSWAACIPALGRFACHSNEKTAKKAVKVIKKVKKFIIRHTPAD